MHDLPKGKLDRLIEIVGKGIVVSAGTLIIVFIWAAIAYVIRHAF